MASQLILQQLFELSKHSLYFEGLGEGEIWKACLKYQDRSDADIEVAMENIRRQDEGLGRVLERKQSEMEQKQQERLRLKQAEAMDRQMDEADAQNTLDKFFET